MSRRSGGFLAAIAVALGSLAVAASAGAKEYRVTQHADPAPNGCTKHDCSLREAIDAANAHPGADVVGLRGGNYKLSRPNTGDVGEDGNDRGDLDVTDPVTIEHIGKGRSKIDADGLDRILQVVGPGNPTKLLKLKLIGGKDPAPDAPKRLAANGDGGGLLAYDSPLTLIKCAVIGNKGAGSGGGIEAGDGLTLKQSVVANNSTGTGVGGGIDAYGAPVDIVLSTIAHNEAANAGGGVSVSNAALHMERSTVSANTGDLGSAGIYLYEAPASTIDSSTINNNIAKEAAGGGIDSDFSTLTVTDSTLWANETDTDGGGIHTEAGAFTGNGLTITHNKADRDKNGSGEDGGIAYAFATNLNLENSILGDNFAGTTKDDCGGTITSDGGNVVQDPFDCGGFGSQDVLHKNPKLGKLDANGGPTRTVSLKGGSPAIGAAVKASATKRDQRGVKRDSHPDSGAYER